MDHLQLKNRSNADVGDGIEQLHGLEAAVRRQLLKFVAEYDRRRAWEQDGAGSMANWLCFRFGMTPAGAEVIVSVAHALEDLPVIGAAYESGLLSWDKLCLAVELADNDTDAEVAADAQEYSLAGLRRIVRQKRAISASEAAVHHRSRSLRWWWEDNSCLRLWGRLPADQGAVVIKAVARIADHAAPGPDGFYESYECRAADALADVCGARIGDDPDPDKSTVVVHVDAGLLAGGDGVAELEDGPFVAAEVGRRLACGARIQVVAHGANGEIVGLGRTARSPHPWLRRQVKRRDRCCRFPGCTRTRFLRPHHIHHWGKGGPTDSDNLVMLCSLHHSLAHEGGWGIRGRASGHIHFVKPDGGVLRPDPARLRDDIKDRVLAHRRE
jgi:hypothetical protein